MPKDVVFNTAKTKIVLNGDLLGETIEVSTRTRLKGKHTIVSLSSESRQIGDNAHWLWRTNYGHFGTELIYFEVFKCHRQSNAVSETKNYEEFKNRQVCETQLLILLIYSYFRISTNTKLYP